MEVCGSYVRYLSAWHAYEHPEVREVAALEQTDSNGSIYFLANLQVNTALEHNSRTIDLKLFFL